MSKNKILMLFIVSGMLTTAVYFAGCGGMAKEKNVSTSEFFESPSGGDSYDMDEIKEETTGSVDKSSQKDAETNPTGAPPDGTTQEKIPAKIIKTADISYQVEKSDESRKTILDVVKKFNARVSSENQTNDGYRVSNTMIIRVEGTAFDSLVDELMKESIYVEHKTVNAQDVTEEYVDLQARLKSKKEVEAQYAAILKQARSINEILEVQDYLGRIREEIESFEGRLKYMEDRVAYSTITLTFYEVLDSVSKKPGRTFGNRMEDAFGSGWSGLVKFFVGLIYLWPVWIILGFLAWLVVFLVKRGRRRRAAKKQAQNP